jgi:hypothetical protein
MVVLRSSGVVATTFISNPFLSQPSRFKFGVWLARSYGLVGRTNNSEHFSLDKYLTVEQHKSKLGRNLRFETIHSVNHVGYIRRVQKCPMA